MRSCLRSVCDNQKASRHEPRAPLVQLQHNLGSGGEVLPAERQAHNAALPSQGTMTPTRKPRPRSMSWATGRPALVGYHLTVARPIVKARGVIGPGGKTTNMLYRYKK
jgi:hypothetical protein